VKQTVLAHHVIQSFSPKDNISSEQALKIAREFVSKHFGPHAQAVIVTHSDREHIHNHIVVNSVDFKGKKIHSNKTSLSKMRQLSNELCKAYALQHSVIDKPQRGDSLSYKEWIERLNENSWKEKIRIDIDKAVLHSQSFEQFKSTMDTLGYDIRDDRKYLSVRKKGREKFTRIKSLGASYTEERLRQRITANDKTMMLVNGMCVDAESFIRRERALCVAANAVLGLQYLTLLEVMIRLILNELFKEAKKFSNSKPYSMWNDFYIRSTFKQYIFLQHNKIRTKDEYERLRRSNQSKVFRNEGLEKVFAEIDATIEKLEKSEQCQLCKDSKKI